MFIYCPYCCSHRYYSLIAKKAVDIFKNRIEQGVVLSTKGQTLTKTCFPCLLRNILCAVATKSLLMSRKIASIAFL